MEKKRLFFDMDNVLVNFKSGIEKLDKATKKKYEGHLDDVPGIFSLMEPMEGAVDAVQKLNEVYDVYILSTAPWENPLAWTEKILWLKNHFGDLFKKKVFITHHKDFVMGDILIDDNSKNGAKDFKGEWIHFGPNGDPRFPDWNAVLKYLMPQKK